MFRLHYAAKVLSRTQRLPNHITTVLRVISTTSPKPNFGRHELPLASNEVLRIIEKTKGRAAVNGSGAGRSVNNSSDDKISKGNDELPKLPVRDEKKLPNVTIVDINSGYGRMDFEDRMEHMDRSDRINEAKQSNNVCREPIIPIIRAMPKVVNIDGYGDDMMYEDKTEWDLASKLEVKQEQKIDSSNKSTNLTAANTETAVVNDMTNNKSSAEPSTQKLHENCAEKVTKAEGLQHAKYEATATTASSNNEVEIICEAPVDIDAFANEQESKQGTVDINAYEDDERFKLPPIPKVRNNVFKFRGIKIIMPKRMLRDATYRYRLDPSDKDKPDDMQICVFEK